MKYLLIAALVALFSCRKEAGLTTKQDGYWTHIQASLEDSLPAGNYASLDLSRAFKSIDCANHAIYLRVGFKAKPFTTDFLVLKTDSAGNILAGRVVHVDREAGNAGAFNGAFTLTSLDQKTVRTRPVSKGAFRNPARKTDPDLPAGSQDLPPAVVTSYTCSGDVFMQWYQLAGMVGDDGSLFYAAASPGGGGGGWPRIERSRWSGNIWMVR